MDFRKIWLLITDGYTWFRTRFSCVFRCLLHCIFVLSQTSLGSKIENLIVLITRPSTPLASWTVCDDPARGTRLSPQYLSHWSTEPYIWQRFWKFTSYKTGVLVDLDWQGPFCVCLWSLPITVAQEVGFNAHRQNENSNNHSVNWKWWNT